MPSVSAAITRNEVAGVMETRRWQTCGRGRGGRVRERARATIQAPILVSSTEGADAVGEWARRWPLCARARRRQQMLAKAEPKRRRRRRRKTGQDRTGQELSRKGRNQRGEGLQLRADGGSTKQPAAVLRARTAGWTVALRCIQQTGSRIRNPIPKGDRQLW